MLPDTRNVCEGEDVNTQQASPSTEEISGANSPGEILEPVCLFQDHPIPILERTRTNETDATTGSLTYSLVDSAANSTLAEAQDRLAREWDELEKEKSMLARERDDLERQREELARMRQSVFSHDALGKSGFFCEHCGRQSRRESRKSSDVIPLQAGRVSGRCVNFGTISRCCWIALGSLYNRFLSSGSGGESLPNERRLPKIKEEPHTNLEEDWPSDKTSVIHAIPAIFARSRGEDKPSVIRAMSNLSFQSRADDKPSVFRAMSNLSFQSRADDKPSVIRAMSSLSFQTCRSSSRDRSLRTGSPLNTLSSVFRNGRGRSRSHNRDNSPLAGIGDAVLLDATSPDVPLVVFKKAVTAALAKVSMKYNLDDPLIKMMIQRAPVPENNKSIRAELLEIHRGLRDMVRTNFTPLTFRSLILGFGVVTEPLRESGMSQLVDIFENQWLIKVRPGANSLIDGRRRFEDYAPLDVYEYRQVANHEGSKEIFSLGTVIDEDRCNRKPAGEGVLWAQRIMELLEGLLSGVFQMVPARADETLQNYLTRLNTEVKDWRGYWRDCYSNSRCRREVLGFAIGQMVDMKMKGSAATLFPPIMLDKVFKNSVKDVESFLIDLRVAMRLLDLIL